MANDIVIIDTGCCNLTSLKAALVRLDVPVTVTTDTKRILAADRVFLPGVGSAGAAMAALKERNLIETVKSLTQPVLGICLGMQVLGAKSEESGGIETLKIMDTTVKQLQTNGLTLPHMGWNNVEVTEPTGLFEGLDGEYFYFVHSFAMDENPFTIARCEYGQRFSAAVRCKNFFGVQFHPERSGKAGAKLLMNFVNGAAL